MKISERACFVGYKTRDILTRCPHVLDSVLVTLQHAQHEQLHVVGEAGGEAALTEHLHQHHQHLRAHAGLGTAQLLQQHAQQQPGKHRALFQGELRYGGVLTLHIVSAFLKESTSFALFNLQLWVTRSSEKYNITRIP